MWPISIDSTIDRIEIEMEEKGKRLSVKNTLVEGICKNIWNRKKNNLDLVRSYRVRSNYLGFFRTCLD